MQKKEKNGNRSVGCGGPATIFEPVPQKLVYILNSNIY